MVTTLGATVSLNYLAPRHVVHDKEAAARKWEGERTQCSYPAFRNWSLGEIAVLTASLAPG
jgi:hypothetical protein